MAISKTLTKNGTKLHVRAAELRQNHQDEEDRSEDQ